MSAKRATAWSGVCRGGRNRRRLSPFLALLCTIGGILPVYGGGTFEILYDSFETPDISGRVQVVPPGWHREIPSYSTMWDEDNGDITTPYGTQVISCWHQNGYQTTNIIDVLQPGVTYTLTFNAGNCNTDTGNANSDTEYTAELLAGTNIIGTVTGITTTKNMSQSDTITVVTTGTHPHLGETLGIRLWMSGGDWHAQAMFDNVRLVATETDEWASSLFYGK